MDCLNMILQKLKQKFKIGKIEERYQVDKQFFICSLSVKVKAKKIESQDSKFFSTKSKAKSYSALKLIQKFYDLGYLDEHMNCSIEVHKRNENVLRTNAQKKREQKVEEFKEFRKNNKAKNNTEEILDVKFEYQLSHDELSKLQPGDDCMLAKMIV